MPPCVIHCFTGTREQAQKYLQLGCYIGLTGYLWKDKSENGVRKILEDGEAWVKRKGKEEEEIEKLDAKVDLIGFSVRSRLTAVYE